LSERPVSGRAGSRALRAAPYLAQRGSSKAVSDLPTPRANAVNETTEHGLAGQAFSRGSDRTRGPPGRGRRPGGCDRVAEALAGAVHRRCDRAARTWPGPAVGMRAQIAEVRPGSAADEFGRGATRSPGPAAAARSSQGQRPAALAAPLEVAAQGLRLIGAGHGPDQQRLRALLDAGQAAELAEQVLVLEAQLTPRGGRPLGAAVLAQVDEPAPGRRHAELQPIALERDRGQTAIGFAVRRVVGQLRCVHAERRRPLALVLDRGE